MSERKRLTDDEWAQKWGARMPAKHRDEALVELRDDHHRAREDLKVVGAMLRVAVAQLDGRESPMIKPVDREAAREIKAAVAVMRATLQEKDL